MTTQRWLVTCEAAEDGSNDIIINLPDELLSAIGAKIGDVLEWSPLDDGAWSIKLKPQDSSRSQD